jgi:hypothetical protein
MESPSTGAFAVGSGLNELPAAKVLVRECCFAGAA